MGVGVGFARVRFGPDPASHRTLSSDIQVERIRTLDPWSEARLPSQPHQLTTKRGRHFRFTVLTEAEAQPDFSLLAFASGTRNIQFLGLVERAVPRLGA